jgi:hypothetical protein
MAATLSSPLLQLPGLRDHQATLNVEKILDTINNLVRILELTLTINLAPPPSPPTPPATVILPKATTLGSGLDQVSPQSASELHSKVLTDRIQSITKWAKAVTPTPTPSPTRSEAITPLAPPQPSPEMTPTSSRDAKCRKAKAECRKAQRQRRKAAAPPASPAPPVGPAFISARPANLGITHPIPLIGPADSCAAPACLGLTCKEILFYPSLAVKIAQLGAPRPSSTLLYPTPASRPPSTIPSVQAPQPTTVWTSMFPTYGSDGILHSPTLIAPTPLPDPVPNWDDVGDDKTWGNLAGFPLSHPTDCYCGSPWGHDSFHSRSGSITKTCKPPFYPPPPTPMPEYTAPDCPNPFKLYRPGEWEARWSDDPIPTAIHPDPLSHFWPGPLHLSKKAVKALTAQAWTLAREDTTKMAAITGSPRHDIAPPNPLIVTNGDSTGNHYSAPIPRFSSLHDLLKWLYDEGFRLDMDPY